MIHDTDFIRTNVGRPFIRLVYKSGTHIYATDSVQDIRHFKEMLDHYENYSQSEFCLYRYDGDKLFPVFPKITRVLIENELTKNTNIKN